PSARARAPVRAADLVGLLEADGAAARAQPLEAGRGAGARGHPPRGHGRAPASVGLAGAIGERGADLVLGDDRLLSRDAGAGAKLRQALGDPEGARVEHPLEQLLLAGQSLLELPDP